MQEQKPRYENESGQELPRQTIEHFNTLQAYTAQPTSLLETTLADTLGLSMHNAITNQQQSQMTTAASITNACARLLQTQTRTMASSTKKAESVEPAIFVDGSDRLSPDTSDAESDGLEEQQTKRFNLFRFLKRNKKEAEE
ncbi:RebB family R body protein [Vibrio mangrovi]|uniref:Killing trait n=1 Tax=Vibrio mangrovi TaxID=474394 RepID=A0A1Y6IR32_9VIBR|nr:RebB family R body protein [Vibrio mangrovi]MDW6001895.1 RebB family R body protein [Vibrio mangrovi]SMS00078.1 Killing trait [Vibrio mangrovi]